MVMVVVVVTIVNGDCGDGGCGDGDCGDGDGLSKERVE